MVIPAIIVWWIDNSVKSWHNLPICNPKPVSTISMHIPSLVILFVMRFYGPVNQMGPCWAWSVYLTTLSLGKLHSLKRLTSIVYILSLETKFGENSLIFTIVRKWKTNVWWADNSVKIDEICLLAIPNQISTISMHIPTGENPLTFTVIVWKRKYGCVGGQITLSKFASSQSQTRSPQYQCTYHVVKIHWHLLLSFGNENMDVWRADNSVKIWWNLPLSNPKPDLHNINAHTKFGENPLLFTKVIIRKRYSRQMDVWHRQIDVQHETIIPHHICMAGYINTCTMNIFKNVFDIITVYTTSTETPYYTIKILNVHSTTCWCV